MKKNIILIILLISGISLFAQEEKADAVYRKLVKEYRLNPDGSWDYKVEKELELLTHFAFHSLYGETFIVYNPDYQDLLFDYAYTIMRDGRKVITPENAFNKVLPRGAADAAAYNHLREMVVTHTGLEVGAVIHLGYSLKNKADFYPEFMGEEMIGESEPVNEMLIRVVMPAGKELYHQIYNIRTAPEITSEGKNTVYTWKFVNLKANSHDSYKVSELMPRILFSASGNLHKTYDRFVMQEAFYFKANRKMKEKAQDIWDENRDELKTMMQLQEMVIKEVREYHVELAESGFRVRPAIETWESIGGTKLEKSCLLVSLLREANISARLVAVIPERFYSREMGNLFVMNDYLVQVNPKEHGQFYLSATGHAGENLIYNYSGDKFLLLEAAVESLRVFDPEEGNAGIQFGSGLVIQGDQKIVGTYETEVKEAANPYLKMVKDTATAYHLVSGFGKADIKSIDIKRLSEDKSFIQFEVEKEKALKQEGSYFFYSLPEPRTELNETYFSSLPFERTDALELQNPLSLEYSYVISYPDDMEWIEGMKNLELENEAGKLVVSVKVKGQSILIEKSLEIPQKIIKVNVYNNFRELMINWYDKHSRQIVLKKK
ncbi:MAG: DUF3857 domain-containing protein [Bacteroidota bacterium]|nr:DUF3857 domain-containing protein [Bacteroidota bacterium]